MLIELFAITVKKDGGVTANERNFNLVLGCLRKAAFASSKTAGICVNTSHLN